MNLGKNLTTSHGVAHEGVPTAFVTLGYPLVAALMVSILLDPVVLVVVTLQAAPLCLAALMVSAIAERHGMGAMGCAVAKYFLAKRTGVILPVAACVNGAVAVVNQPPPAQSGLAAGICR